MDVDCAFPVGNFGEYSFTNALITMGAMVATVLPHLEGALIILL